MSAKKQGEVAKTEGRVNAGEKRRSEVHQKFHSKNLSKLDKIRKEVYCHEWKWMKKWYEKYHFLTGEYFKKVLEEECRNLTVPSFEPCEQNNTRILGFDLKSSPSMPTTSSAIVGWRSEQLYSLEFAGTKYISPKHTIEPPLQGDEFRIKKQHFLFLG